MLTETKRFDIVLIAAAALGLFIVAESIYALHWASTSGNFSHFKDMYDSVVKGTLLPLFTTVVAIKVGYTVALTGLRALVNARGASRANSQ